jgi:hypothetical protein
MKRKFWLLLVAAFTAVTVAHSWQTKVQPAVIATQPRKDAPNILMILARVI